MLNLEKNESTELFTNTATAYYFLSQPIFSMFVDAGGITLDEAMEKILKNPLETALIKKVCSKLAVYSWDVLAGPELAFLNGIIGWTTSIAVGDIIKLLIENFEGLIEVYNNAKANCSIYPYPNSSWELIMEINWVEFPPYISSINWTYQGSNTPPNVKIIRD
ncbi:hypothetical protein [uncultured Clostridium sp.]|uniref:hypothetical protein n=1 Tax=uncultured Clostridium sp. TaxID=59620 RepID=UPI00263247D2|nr:hypothetical protein [uncultured Clostridium sp.]